MALIVLSMVATWPLLLHMDEFLFVSDPMIYAWDLWWVKEALVHADNPWSTTQVLAPDGTSLAFHALVPFVGVVTAPFTAVLGPGLVYNLLKLLLPVLAAVTAQRAAHALGLRGWAAWVAGCLYGFSTIVVWRTTFHLNFGAGLALMPLPLLFCVRYEATRQRRAALAAGAAVGVIVLTDPTIALFAVITAGAYVLAALCADRSWRSWSLLVILAGGATMVVALPQLIAMAQAIDDDLYEQNLAALASNWVTANTSLRTMFSPGAVREFLPGTLETIAFRSPSGEATPVFGWAVLSLAATAVVILLTRRGQQRALTRHAVVWAVGLAATAMVLAMGPEIRIGDAVHVPLPVERHGQTLSGLLPYTWLTGLPLFGDVRIPARFVMLGILPLSVLAGLGAQLLVMHGRATGRAFVVLAIAFGVIESGQPDGGTGKRWVPLQRDRLYAPVKADHSNSIVVDVPLGFIGATAGAGRSREQEGMLRAAEHGHPIAGGYLSRLTQREVDSLVAHPFYGQVLANQGPPNPALPPVSTVEAAADAAKLDVGWVVVWPEADRTVIPFLRRTGFSMVREDEGTLLFHRRR